MLSKKSVTKPLHINIKLLLKQHIDKIKLQNEPSTHKGANQNHSIHFINHSPTNQTTKPIYATRTRPHTGISTPNELTPITSPVKYNPSTIPKKNAKPKNNTSSSDAPPINMTNVNVFLPSHSSHFMFYNNFIIKNSLQKFQSKPSTRENSTKRKKCFHGYKNSIACIDTSQIVVTKYSYYTKVGFMPDNPHKQNQDNFIIATKLNGKIMQHFFAVADGHGINGKEVSLIIKEKLPTFLEHLLTNKKTITEAITQSYAQTNKEIINSGLDIDLSGSTCVGLLVDSQTLYCANVGDSRAIICSIKNNKITGRPLSRDHKPTLHDEAKRIKEKGGRIEPFTDTDGEKIGPLRVWMKDEDIPGLAMTRSFGDAAGAAAGVIHMPEIKQFTLCAEDKFIIIGSDGIWEFISNNEAAEIVYPMYLKNSAESGADLLVKEAQARWKQVYF